jgi:hypothetical protein
MKNPGKLTDKQVIDNINASCSCPFCKGDNLDADTPDIDDMDYTMKIICCDCETKYVEYGKLTCTGFEITEKNKKAFKKTIKENKIK